MFTRTKPSPALMDGTEARVSRMGFDRYRAIQAVNKSLLDHIAPPRTPAHCRAAMDRPEEETPALRLGRLTHSAILEPAIMLQWAIAPPDMDFRTKSGKEFRAEAEAAGKELLRRKEADQILAMGRAVWSHPRARELLTGAKVERSTFAWHERTGLACKGRLDVISSGNMLADLKTAPDASPYEFARSMASWRYHVQAAFYLDLYAAIDAAPRAFAFLVVEKEPPYAVALYLPSPGAIEQGRLEYERDLVKFAACYVTDRWPGYPEDWLSLDLPPWYGTEPQFQVIQ